ncbi:hypothetical protein B7494_g6369 [Chlorociboria aeruginascens]|nr:hypothetical protein B7494_g6369 [Chlorociboria aeruginascens]
MALEVTSRASIARAISAELVKLPARSSMQSLASCVQLTADNALFLSGQRRRGDPIARLAIMASLVVQLQFAVNPPQLSPEFIAQYNEHGFDNGNGNGHPSPQHDGLLVRQNTPPIYTMDSYMQMLHGPRIRPLDSQFSRSARFIGDTGESNPYLLRHYIYDDNDECTISKLTYRRIQSNPISDGVTDSSKGEPPVVFMLADDSLAQKGEPRVEDAILEKARRDVDIMFTEPDAIRLIGLFFTFVYPYFPILCKSEFFSSGVILPSVLHTQPLSLLSAMYATALPFMLYDEHLATTIVHSPPSAHQLFRISWISVTQELHTPRMATLQACLLLLQRAPTNRYTTDTPWKTSLIGWTVSLAQILGLTRECSTWSSLPTWEMNLRKRLWHGVFIMDKWASLGAGMPSHIRNEDYDVLPMADDDLEPPFEQNTNTIPAVIIPAYDTDHFRLLSELTLILSDIMDTFYSLRATQRTSKDLSLSLNLAQSLRARLKAWNNSLPQSMALRQSEYVDSRGIGARLSGNPSLLLAYIVATMTLFRALLRPMDNLCPSEDDDHHSVLKTRQAIRVGAKECAKEVVEFVENLGREALDAFWHSWSRANFAIASSFLMQLLVTSRDDLESDEINDLVSRWRLAMRVGSGSQGSGLMSLGLLRLDGMLCENRPAHHTG